MVPSIFLRTPTPSADIQPQTMMTTSIRDSWQIIRSPGASPQMSLTNTLFPVQYSWKLHLQKTHSPTISNGHEPIGDEPCDACLGAVVSWQLPVHSDSSAGGRLSLCSYTHQPQSFLATQHEVIEQSSSYQIMINRHSCLSSQGVDICGLLECLS